METLRPFPGFASDATRPSYSDRTTPPYTSVRQKRRLERSDSPASSIHPVETSSPAKKLVKRATTDTVIVSELTEADPGYHTDLDVVYPQELEELSSFSDEDEHNISTDDWDSDAEQQIALTTRLGRLDCTDDYEGKDEAEMEQRRQEARLHRRHASRAFKRSHSQSVKSESAGTATLPNLTDVDVDAMDDQDFSGRVRRLRRRTKGPGGLKELFENAGSDVMVGSPGGSASEAGRTVERRRKGGKHRSQGVERLAMEVE
jgi:hypothetical protein